MSKMTRRNLLQAMGAAGAALTIPSLLSGCGAKKETAPAPAAKGTAVIMNPSQPVKIGFIPLTDCASVVMAQELGLFEHYGVKVEVTKEASWANVRDKLLTGDLHGAHCLFGMPFSVYTGVGGQAGKEMYVAMMLNQNGQGITLSSEFAGVGQAIGKVKPVVERLKAAGKEPSFAMTFPGGTHDIWLRYWLAAAGYADQSQLKIITIPPPQMVSNMKVGNMQGFCVGEPWNGVAVKQEIGFTHLATQQLWKHHPEKALVVSKSLVERRDELKAVMKAVLAASRWLDHLENRKQAAQVLSKTAFVSAPVDVIEGRLLGQYDLGDGMGRREYTDDTMWFHRQGNVNFPRMSHGIWFMAQYMRFGYLKAAPDYAAIAKSLILQDLYREVAADMQVALPADDMKPFTVDLDGHTFDPKDVPGSLSRYGGGA